MIPGSAVGSLTFTDADGRLVYVESGVASVTVSSPDAAIYSTLEEVSVGPALASPPSAVVAFVCPQRFDDNFRQGEPPSTEMWRSAWNGWRFDGQHVLLGVSLAVEGPGVRLGAISYHVTFHGHVELGPKLERDPGLHIVEPLPPVEPRP